MTDVAAPPLSVRWLGAAHFEVACPEGTVSFDPWVKSNPGCPIAIEDLTDVSAIIVTHGHPGHYGRGDAVELARLTGAPFAAPAALARYVCDERLLSAQQIVPLTAGERRMVGPVEIEALELPHPPVRHEFTVDGPPGEPNFAYLARIAGRCVMHVGDTTPDAAFGRIGQRERVDVAFLPLWAKEMVWTEDEALESMLRVIDDLRPSVVIPHARYRSEVTTPSKAAAAVRQRGIPTTVIPLSPGDRLPL